MASPVAKTGAKTQLPPWGDWANRLGCEVEGHSGFTLVTMHMHSAQPRNYAIPFDERMDRELQARRERAFVTPARERTE